MWNQDVQRSFNPSDAIDDFQHSNTEELIGNISPQDRIIEKFRYHRLQGDDRIPLSKLSRGNKHQSQKQILKLSVQNNDSQNNHYFNQRYYDEKQSLMKQRYKNLSEVGTPTYAQYNLNPKMSKAKRKRLGDYNSSDGPRDQQFQAIEQLNHPKYPNQEQSNRKVLHGNPINNLEIRKISASPNHKANSSSKLSPIQRKNEEYYKEVHNKLMGSQKRSKFKIQKKHIVQSSDNVMLAVPAKINEYRFSRKNEAHQTTDSIIVDEKDENSVSNNDEKQDDSHASRLNSNQNLLQIKEDPTHLGVLEIMRNRDRSNSAFNNDLNEENQTSLHSKKKSRRKVIKFINSRRVKKSGASRNDKSHDSSHERDSRNKKEIYSTPASQKVIPTLKVDEKTKDKKSQFKTPSKSTHANSNGGSVSNQSNRSSKASSKRRDKTSEKSATDKVDQLIAKSIKILDKIKEEFDHHDAMALKEDPSPKVQVGITNTWGDDIPKGDDTCRDIMNDFEDLDLQYRLRENWLELDEKIKKPFIVDVSVIDPKNGK